MTEPLTFVFVGLSLSSSWGNGHATTYRALLRGLRAEGHRVLFLERDVSWYASHRDLPEPDFCVLHFYSDVRDLERHEGPIRSASAVIVGSYVPDGVKATDLIAAMRPRRLCFYDIDTPVTLAKLGRGDEEYLARRQVPLFDTYLSFTGGPTLQRLEHEFGARRADALHCAVDPTLYSPRGGTPIWDLGYLGTYSQDRQPALERLLIEPARRRPQMRFAVAGPQYPETIEWPDNVERIAHLPPSEHAAFYSRQRFTLNVTRADMITCGWSPSVRLFEAAACGTPIVSDRWKGLPELFPEGTAIAIADSSDDVIRLLDAGDEQLVAMGMAARRIVLAEHTGRARARELALIIHSLGARRTGSRRSGAKHEPAFHA